VDPRKIEVITKWHGPLSWSFAILGYYSLVAPLTSKTKFVGAEDCELAFENVKFSLTCAPILPYPS
jgi:hypothetical protein